MSGQLVRRALTRLSVVVIAVVMSAVNIRIASATPPLGMSQLGVSQFDCANFRYSVTGYPVSGYAGLRIWINGPSGTPIIDSYTSGHIPYFVPIGNMGTFESGGGFTQGAISFGPEPAGTVLYARLYRAPNAQPGSWDGQNYVDTSVTCNNGVNLLSNWLMGCNYYIFAGSAYPASGYVGVRVWIGSVGGPILLDSYVSGNPGYFTGISGNGQFSGTAAFAQQPTGTVLVGRLYRALSQAPGSYDGGQYVDRTWTCS